MLIHSFQYFAFELELLGIEDIYNPKSLGKELGRFKGFSVEIRREKFVNDTWATPAQRALSIPGPGAACLQCAIRRP